MRFLFCYLTLFGLSGLVMGSMESPFLADIFGNGAAESFPAIFAMPLLLMIEKYFRDIKRVYFWLLFIASVFTYIILVIIFVK